MSGPPIMNCTSACDMPPPETAAGLTLIRKSCLRYEHLLPHIVHHLELVEMPLAKGTMRT